MCDISHSFNRHSVVDFSEYLYSDEHTFIAQHPSDLLDQSWSYLLLPFDLPTWLLTAGTGLGLFATLTLKGQIRERRGGQVVGSSFLKTLSVFLLQCT